MLGPDRRSALRRYTAVLAGLLCLVVSSPAEAATIDVTTTEDRIADNGDCALREAVISANEDRAVDGCAKGAYVDTILLKGDTYRLSIPGPLENLAATGDLDLTDPVEIVGKDGKTRIVAAPADRVFHVLGVDASFRGLTITGGDVSYQETTPYYEEGRGGGVLLQSTPPGNAAVLRLENSTVTANRAYLGGGIATALDRSMDPYLPQGYNPKPSGAEISRSTISRNHSISDGGGIYVQFGGGSILNSTLSGNYAGAMGGGLSTFLASFKILGSTIAGNRAVEGGGFTSSGLSADSENGSVIGGSIVSGNEAAFGPDCSGSINSTGANVVGSTSNCELNRRPDSTRDLLDVNPRLGPLANNGGPTKTHAIKTASPANNLYVGRGRSPSGTYPFYCETTDQRGEVRSADGRLPTCDAGAFELVECRGLPASIIGTAQNDRIIGTSGADVIQSASGDDEIRSMGGDDTVCAAAGDDLIASGSGRDHVEAGVGSDTVRAGGGNDIVRGLQPGGFETLDDADRIYGARGKDRLYGESDADRILGGLGSDVIDGGELVDACDGGAGRDRLRNCETRLR